MNKAECYRILELDTNADENTIRKKYKKLAMKYHPDRNKDHDAADKFKQISEAHDTLINKKTNHHEELINNLFRMNQNPFQGFNINIGNNTPFNNVFSTNVHINRQPNNLQRIISFENGVKVEKIIQTTHNQIITTTIRYENGSISKNVVIQHI